jgi:hypothetical protein
MRLAQICGELAGSRVHPTALDSAKIGRAGYREQDAHDNNYDYKLEQSKAALVF